MILSKRDKEISLLKKDMEKLTVENQQYLSQIKVLEDQISQTKKEVESSKSS